jgi:Prenyltransferase and squalene oxidase repeat
MKWASMYRFARILFPSSFVLVLAATVLAQEPSLSQATGPQAAQSSSARTSDSAPAKVLPPGQWRRVDAAVSRALTWLATQQKPDGSFRTLDSGQPGVTSLCMMAFIAHGHVPGTGQYGARLERAVDYLLSCQKQNGLVTKLGPDGPEINRRISHAIGGCATYNHAISSLVLSEVYGMNPPRRARRLEAAIRRALDATLEMQAWPKDSPADRGGWRYVDDFDEVDSDLSITGWQLMFLRSARNAGFEVPTERIDDAVSFVKRSFDPRQGIFIYSTRRPSRTRSMAGAGILALAHAGFHRSEEAQRAGDWLLAHGFEDYNATIPGQRSDRYHYGLFNCCQAMYQLGGKYWEQFYPPAVEAVLANQQPDGSWPVDSQYHDAPYGKAYSTALVVIMLGAPNQLLPIYQR